MQKNTFATLQGVNMTFPEEVGYTLTLHLFSVMKLQ